MQKMMDLRAQKVAGMVSDIPELEVNGPDRGKLLVVGWGNTLGPITAAVERAQERGMRVSSIHLRHLNPFPSNLQAILQRFDRILVPELNMGQLVRLLRAEFLAPAEGFPKLQGRPFQVEEIEARINRMLHDEA